MHRLIILVCASTLAFAEASGPGGGSAPAGPAPAGAPAAQQGSPMFMILMMVAVFAFMWFVMIRPQKKEEKRRREMIDSTKRGDRVVTIGGVHAVVETVGEATVDLRIGDDKGVVATFNKTAIAQNVSAENAAKDKK